MRIQFYVTALLTALSLQASAFEFISTTNYVTTAGETIAEEQWIYAGGIDARGDYRNDLFMMAGDTMSLNGSYAGDIWGLGSRTTTINGDCDRNLRLAGFSITINSAVGGNIMALADTVIISTNAVISGDVMIYANTLVVEGQISGDADLTAVRLATLGGTIEGHTSLHASEILLARDAQLKGNFSYTSNKELFPDEGVVQGTITRIVPEPEPMFSIRNLRSTAFWFIGAVLVGIPFISLFPMTTAMASQLIRKNPLKCMLVGLVASIALPFIALMSASSLIGVPLGTLLMASWGILLYIGRILTGLVLGGLILRGMGASIGRVLLSAAIGLAVIYFSTIIPPIGIPLQMAALWMGMGALLISLMEKRRLILQVPQNLKQLEELRDEKYNPEENKS